jgi:glycosyltransferase involved in cell wall biosynthesis
VRVAVVTADVLAPAMAGPAIRAFQIARALSSEHEVRLVSTGRTELTHPDFQVEHADDRSLRRLVAWCDIFVFQGWILESRPFIAKSDKILVADIYDPMHLEQLEQGHEAGDEEGRRAAVANTCRVLNEQMLRADLLLCASPKQRDFWLGALATLGRVNSVTYDDDPSMQRLIEIVPFGVSDQPPARTRPAIKGVMAGVGPDDKVILWGGGIYNWFDPLTLLRAVDRLRVRIPEVRLVFMGLKHPNPEIPEMRMAVQARRLSDELGLTGSHVFFNEQWVAYDDRQNYLLDADIGVSTHLHHVETEFSFRTRILDYLWAGLPVVATGGDSLADLLELRGAGLAVPPGDPEALEGALERLLTDEGEAGAFAARSRAIGEEMRWQTVLEPVVSFCRRPRRSPDLLDPTMGPIILAPLARSGPRSKVVRDLRLIHQHLSAGGPGLLLSRIRSRVRRTTSARRPGRAGSSRPSGAPSEHR